MSPDLAKAIDGQLELEEKYEKLQTDPITFTYEEGIQKQIDSCGGDLTEEAAKTLMVGIRPLFLRFIQLFFDNFVA